MSTSQENDLYVVLGIKRDATETDIKKAFKKMALKHHPDKNPTNQKESEEKFKIIAEAYEILSDKNKRAVYDRYGMSGVTGHLPPNASFEPGFNMNFGFVDESKFTFQHAQSVFEDFMKRFGNFDNDFFRGGFSNAFGQMNGNRTQQQRQQQQQQYQQTQNQSRNIFGGFSGFNNDFFSNDLFDPNYMNTMGGTGSSKSVSTVIKNGKKTTVTKTTTRQPDGTAQTDVTEETFEGNRKINENRYTEDAEGNRIQYTGFIQDKPTTIHATKKIKK